MMAADGTSDQIWVLLDDRAGNRAQALGVAARLGRPYRQIDVTYGPWAKLPNALLGASMLGLDRSSRRCLVPPWPRLVIAAGRRTAPIARWIRRQGGPGVRLVHIMDPGSGHQDFSLICRPRHDDQSTVCDNVMIIPAAPHGLSPSLLAEEAANLEPRLSHVPKPRIGVLVGGATRRRAFTDAMAYDLCRRAEAAAASVDGGLLLSTSRRTGRAVDTIGAALIGPNFLYRWDRPDGDNPYRGILGASDALIVTGESVSMCSEACSTGKPVYIYAPEALITPKHARLHETLYNDGYARPFADDIDFDWRPSKLDVSGEIVAEIHQRTLLG